MPPTLLKTKPTKASVFAPCKQQKILQPLSVPAKQRKVKIILLLPEKRRQLHRLILRTYSDKTQQSRKMTAREMVPTLNLNSSNIKGDLKYDRS